MTAGEDQRGWRTVPPALLLAFAIELVFELVRVVQVLTAGDYPEWGAGWALSETGIGFAVHGLGIVGALDLAARTTGRATIGARIAAAGFALALLLELGWLGFQYAAFDAAEFPFDLFRALRAVSTLATLVTAVGLGLATRRVVVAIALGVVAIACEPPWFLAEWVYGGLELGWRGQFLLDLAPRFVVTAALVATVLRAAPPSTTPAPEPSRASRGLQLVSNGLWLRVLAVGVLASAVLAGASSRSALDLYRVAALAGQIVSIVAFAMFVLGALAVARACVADLGRWPWYVAAVAALWAGGVVVAQTPHLYRLLYNEAHGSFGFDSGPTTQYATALATTLPLVAGAAIVLALISITRFARGRNLDDLRENATVRTGAFVVLVLGSVFVQRYGLARAPGEASGLVIILMLGTVGANLYANAIAAKLCRAAAAVVDRDPGLPTAKVVSDA
jgi:hypothetical protein